MTIPLLNLYLKYSHSVLDLDLVMRWSSRVSNTTDEKTKSIQKVDSDCINTGEFCRNGLINILK